MARYGKTTISLPISGIKSLGKLISKATAPHREKEMRKRCVAAAKLARDAIADNAPNTLYMRLLHSEKLERYYNKNPGYDIKMEAGAKFTFVLQLSTNRFPASLYKGYNPVWGLIVSNYGRRAIDVQSPSAIPLPTDSPVSSRGTRTFKNKPYNHPKYGTGYQGRYSGKFVMFTRHVDAVVGTHWIEEGLRNAATGMKNILSSGKGISSETGLDRGARTSKAAVL